ncbi:hypothetical protein FN846DRAFT_126634 [Sphaerosporella brunnea]|uniref:Uncharacterized protein n=1 Tax=Sphaerosporella brunnea TaxID=1250544 RepID=A0A5J5ERT4_9PEZI|nr:hypothetical protein FN846DRAFT_126634 [Sphaerosporella brunnea]
MLLFSYLSLAAAHGGKDSLHWCSWTCPFRGCARRDIVRKKVLLNAQGGFTDDSLSLCTHLWGYNYVSLMFIPAMLSVGDQNWLSGLQLAFGVLHFVFGTCHGRQLFKRAISQSDRTQVAQVSLFAQDPSYCGIINFHLRAARCRLPAVNNLEAG